MVGTVTGGGWKRRLGSERVLVGLTVLFVLALTVVYGSRSGLAQRIETLGGIPAARGEAPPYELTRLRVFNRVLFHVTYEYVDPRRIDPRRMLLGALDAIEGTVPEPDRDAHNRRLRAAMQQAIASLGDEQREVFLLREHAGLQFKDIGDITGVSENTVKSRMRYALEKLREQCANLE